MRELRIAIQRIIRYFAVGLQVDVQGVASSLVTPSKPKGFHSLGWAASSWTAPRRSRLGTRTLVTKYSIS